MGSLYSGVGLMSGLDIQSLVDQLISIEARPRDLLVARVAGLDAQRAAYLDISARLSALLGRVDSLSNRSFFESTVGSSSNSDILGVTTSSGAMPGSYNFIVRSLASTHQMISQGYQSRDALLTNGSISIESAQARVNRATELSELNGFTGVQAGSFKIFDADGDDAVINIHSASTVGDVIDAINESGIDVTAAMRGEALVLTESNGGDLRIREMDGDHTAADLGFEVGNTSGTGELVGSDIVYLADTTPLMALNDGNGLRRSETGDDFTITYGNGSFNVDLSDILKVDTRLERLNHGEGVELGTIRITTKDGVETDVELTGLTTIGEVQAAIQDNVPGVSVSVTGSGLVISDSTTVGDDQVPVNFVIEDITGHAARDLGIDANTDMDKVTGRDPLHVDTLGDIINAINYAAGNENGEVVASVDTAGRGLVITDNSSGGTQPFVLSIEEDDDGNPVSKALYDLGLEPGVYGQFGDRQAAGQRIIGGMDTVLLKTLNGGNGYAGGTLQIDVAGGGSAIIDMSAAETLRDVVEAINAESQASGLGVVAGYDSTGTRLLIEHEDQTQITLSGDFAETLGIDQSGTRVTSDNLQRQYISETTELSDLNLGRGVQLGRFRVTNSEGTVTFVDLTRGNVKTLQDVIDEINLQAVGVEASINATGDGLVITDTAGGTFTMKIEDESGSSARDLNLSGEAVDGQVDGSFEYHIETATNDTLESLVTRINSDVALASATVFNDGTDTAPYRLSISSQATGADGELIVDGSLLNMDFTTLSRAQDASIVLGNDPDGGVLITSSSNTFADVVEGVTINVNGVSDDPVTVTIGQDLDSVVSTLSGLVSDFNAALDRIDELSSYNAETEQRGVLLGESAIHTMQNRLYRMVSGTFSDSTGLYTRLSQLGVEFGDGARLSFNEDEFRDAYKDNPEEVIQFFADVESGWATLAEEKLDAIAGDDGLIERRGESLENQKSMLSDRIEQLNDLLDRKQARLLAQFQAMETALASLQSQSAALTSLSSLASTYSRS